MHCVYVRILKYVRNNYNLFFLFNFRTRFRQRHQVVITKKINKNVNEEVIKYK